MEEDDALGSGCSARRENGTAIHGKLVTTTDARRWPWTPATPEHFFGGAVLTPTPGIPPFRSLPA